MSNNSKIKAWRPNDIPDLSDKTIVITGANSGLGFETANALAKKNARLILLCRNQEKAQQAIQKILNTSPNARIENIALDLASFDSIHQAADQVLTLTDHIDVLINNAGIMMIPKRTLTKDGLEMQMGVNHLGHFLLTQRLFLAVEKAHGRIIVLGSVAHKMSPFGLRIDNINSDYSYQSLKTYSQSKLANVIFGKALANKITQANKNVTVITVHPGYSRTNLQSTGPSGLMTFLMKFSDLVAQSANKGAWPSMIAATSDLMQHGGYYGPTWLDIVGPDGECSVTRHVNDTKQQDVLWKKSEELTKCQFTII